MQVSSRNLKSSVGLKPIPSREAAIKSAYQWLEDRKALDGAEGLWRVHDKLYDVTDFIKKHPGGEFWLDGTKGVDITEAFECHHISTNAEKVLEKYFVRNASTPRNSPFTFHPDGFYRTLKRNVQKVLPTLPKNTIKKSNRVIDSTLACAFTLAILATYYWSFIIGTFAGLFLSFTALACHSYYHRKDNFRMHYNELALMQTNEWRIIHVLSHHMYPNTISDLQGFLVEPFLQYYPHTKSFLVKNGSWVYGPLIIWPTFLLLIFLVRIYNWLIKGNNKVVRKTDLLGAILPTLMFALGGQDLLHTLIMWIFILVIHGTWFAFTGFATSHLHPDVFFDGDKPRPENERDWGYIQLDATSDRWEIMGNHALSLIMFGDHAVHHLFPTLDHAILKQLYPVVEETMKQFNLNIRITSYPEIVAGYFKRISMEKQNPNPPDLFKGKVLF